jgi:hypothetical protein
MTAPEQTRETNAFLGMARKLRQAFTQRDEFVSLYRERFDRAQDDLRMPPEKRAKIAAEFLQAVYKADHLYEDRLAECLEEYRELVTEKERDPPEPSYTRR